MAMYQVQMVNNVKTLVPVSGDVNTNSVTDNDMHPVTSNAVAESFNTIKNLTDTPTVIGKWTDGTQDLKRIVLSITFTRGQANENIDLSSYGINEAVNIHGVISAVISSSQRYNFPFPCNWDSSWRADGYINTQNHNLTITRGSEFYNRTCYGYIFIEYV